MKYLLFALVLAACWAPPTIPKGYKPCASDNDCSDTQVCWFHGVDTYAVCIEDPNQ